MQTFIDYLKSEKIIRSLREFYKENVNDIDEKELLNKIIEKFSLLEVIEKNIPNHKEPNLSNLNFDIFGSLYQNVLNHEEKKKLGEFYTPTTVVNYILDAVDYNYSNEIETKKIIDISCGSGSFLIQIIRRFIYKYLQIYKRKKISELTVEEAKSIVFHIENNIYGIDINRIACILCQINIHFVLFEIFKLIRTSHKNYQLPWFNIKKCNAFLLDKAEKYDYVIGNPPYVFIRNIPEAQRKIIESCNFETFNGQYDYYQIFIELGIKLLKNQGLLGYIIPDSLLALSNRSIIRKYIYNATKIKEIYHTGPKFNNPIVSNIIIILQKENNIFAREENQIKITYSSQHEKMIQQTTLKSWDFRFLIHLNKKDIRIIEFLNKNFQILNDLNKTKDFKVTLIRGVELTKSGEIILCEQCKKYFPLPKKELKCRECNGTLKEENKETIIYDTRPNNIVKDYELFLYSINRYQKKSYKYIDISKIGINYKNFKNYKDRIIIRQISQNNLICATYDNNLSLTSQSFYNLKIDKSPIPEFSNLYLLGILNSKLLSYYFIKSFGSYKKLFPRILIEKIKNFPIKIPNSFKEREKAKEIIKYVKNSLNNADKIEYNQRKLDSLVFDLYQISDKKREYIWNFMNSLNN